EQICQRVTEARKKPPESPGIKPKSSRKTPQQEALVQLLTGIVHQRALETSLGPATLAPKKDLEKLVAGDPDNKLLSGWRKSMIGDELLTLLQGKKSIYIRDGAVKMEAIAI
ncbi:MAG: ribonuclease D, partial [Pseudomonadota bacterium]|nr:ribonuclease D [Pseudomonadota bacterium]